MTNLRSGPIKAPVRLATGYNVVDVDAARERGVPVCNVPGYGTSSVAQFAIALLLEICCRVGHHDQAVHQGRWSACPDYCFWDYPLVELAGGQQADIAHLGASVQHRSGEGGLVGQNNLAVPHAGDDLVLVVQGRAGHL